MAGTGGDRPEGLAEQSLNTSIVPPTESTPVESSRSAGSRTPTGTDQRKGLEKTDAADPKPDDSTKPEE